MFIQQPLKNLSIISVILLVFALPLTNVYISHDSLCIPIRIFYGVKGFVLNLGLALWMFRYGLSIGERWKIKNHSGVKLCLIILAMALFVNYHYVIAKVDRMEFYSELSDKLFGLSMPLLWRIGSLGLYNLAYMIIGILFSNKENKLSGRIFKYSWMYLGVLLLIYCAGEILYFNEKGLSSFVFALAVIPMSISILSIYKWSCSEMVNLIVEKYDKISKFLAFLCPSVIIVFLLGGYFRVALFYLILMWLIYKWHK